MFEVMQGTHIKHTHTLVPKKKKKKKSTEKSFNPVLKSLNIECILYVFVDGEVLHYVFHFSRTVRYAIDPSSVV